MKCALITGGSRGIGRAICIKMAGMGYYVLVNYKSNEEEANNTLAMIRQGGGEGELLPFDVSEKDQVRQSLGRWIAANEEKYIEVLVNNAGIKDDVLMAWMEDEQWEQVIKTNLDGFFYVTRLVLKTMLLKKYGRIINVVSLSGLKGLAGQTNYSAAKAVAPGFIKTDMTEGLDEKELQKLVPARRFGLPEEVAHAVGFLASPEAAYITAQVLSINGGLYS
jgi:3-oxoacyl-[acyl-carrier protein] reductase